MNNFLRVMTVDPAYRWISQGIKVLVPCMYITALCCMGCQGVSDGEVFFKDLKINNINVPSREGGEPNLVTDVHGNIFLTWIEYQDDSTDILKYSQLSGLDWSAPKEIARGSDWFVNWADFPSMVHFMDDPNAMAAHWLQKSDTGVYDYDVRIAISTDGGEAWSGGFVPYGDRTAAEHGFVSMLPLPEGRILSVWLDGRMTKSGEKHDEGHAGSAAMTLRAAEFDSHGQVFNETELDNMVCDCCQTDVAMTSRGPLVVYRDRTRNEIRDISVIRQIDGEWSEPELVFPDQWKIPGCPVNGPAVAANGDRVVIAWFTSAQDTGMVKVVFSDDGGLTFSDPVRIDQGNPLGRVDVVIHSENVALISWIEQEGRSADVRLAAVRKAGLVTQPVSLIDISPSRRSGFPILEKAGESYFLAWTETEPTSGVKTVKIQF